MIILKSRIKQHIMSARKSERANVEKEWKNKLDRAITEQKGIYDLLIQEKEMEIDMLNSIIEQNKTYMFEADEKEINSKKILLKAKEIAVCCDYEFKKHLENSARSMAQFDRIRHDTEIFSKKLLDSK